jgi:sterol desaturase/sphingolipid hydroxylase (fatty acid hydroxylase superfamily)
MPGLDSGSGSTRTEWPRNILFLITLPFLPLAHRGILVYTLTGLVASLVLHAMDPEKINIPLTMSDKLVIGMNLGVSAVMALVFLSSISDNVYDVQSLWDVPPGEALLLPLWAASDEVIFFFGHMGLHRGFIYPHIHKMHHKFKVTSAWTTFYGHPLDIGFIMLAAYACPYFMLRHFGWKLSAPSVALFMHGAVGTFISSHHTVVAGDGRYCERDHGSGAPRPPACTNFHF